MNEKSINKALNFQNSPVAWFVVLERAKKNSDFDLAAKAKHELERLGVIVNYRKAEEGECDEQ